MFCYASCLTKYGFLSLSFLSYPTRFPWFSNASFASSYVAACNGCFHQEQNTLSARLEHFKNVVRKRAFFLLNYLTCLQFCNRCYCLASTVFNKRLASNCHCNSLKHEIRKRVIWSKNLIAVSSTVLSRRPLLSLITANPFTRQSSQTNSKWGISEEKAIVFCTIFYSLQIPKYCLANSGVFKGRRARHLPRAPLFGGSPWSATRVNFPYFWWNSYYSLI